MIFKIKTISIIIMTVNVFLFGKTDKKLAVFNPTGIYDMNIIEIIRDKIIDTILNKTQYKVLEREEINRILLENKYQQSGFVDPQQIKEMGIQLGADYVIITSIKIVDNTYFIFCRLVDIETAEIIKSGTSHDKDFLIASELSYQ